MELSVPLSMNPTHACKTSNLMSINILNRLIHLSESCSQLSTKQYLQILQEFIQEFSMKAIIDIIFCGLYNAKTCDKGEWISFINHKIDELSSETETKDIFNFDKTSLMCLHDDTLTSICQYLTISELSHLEQCNRFLFIKIRTSPHCLITLNYPEWLDYWQNDNIYQINRLSTVKKLYIPEKFKYNKSWITEPVKHIHLLQPIFKNLTHLTIYHKLQSSFLCKSLISLTTNRMSLLSTIGTIDSLIELNINQLYINGIGQNFELSVNDITKLLHSKLQKLSIDTSSRNPMIQNLQQSDILQQNYHGIKHLLQQKQRSVSLWNSLRHFSYKKSISAPKCGSMLSLSNKIISNCKHLQSLCLINMNVEDYNEMFGAQYEDIKLHCDNLQDVKLYISSFKMHRLLQYLIKNKPKLKNIDLLLWDDTKDTSFYFNGSNRLNLLKDLLIQQLSNNHTLRDITFTMKFTRFPEYVNKKESTLQRLKLLYLMLIHVFKDNKTKYRKELNITLNIDGKGTLIDDVDEYLGEYHTIYRLMDILNKNVECFTIILNISVNHIWHSWTSFLYGLRSRHQFTSSGKVSLDTYTYKIVNIPTFHHSDYDDPEISKMKNHSFHESTEELRFQRNAKLAYVANCDVFEDESFAIYPNIQTPFTWNYAADSEHDDDDDDEIEKDFQITPICIDDTTVSTVLFDNEDPIEIVLVLLHQYPQIETWLKSMTYYEAVITSRIHAIQFLSSLIDSQPQFAQLIKLIQVQLKQRRNNHTNTEISDNQ